MSRIAYVNGRYLPLRARRRFRSRIAAFNSATASTRSAKCATALLIDETRHLARLDVFLGSAAHRAAGRRGRAAPASCARSSREIACATDSPISRSRAASRGATTAFPPRRSAPGLVVTARSLDPRIGEANAARGVACRHAARRALGASAYQDRCNCCPTCSPSRRRARLARRKPGSSTSAGCITEGASTNAWIVTEDGVLVTRPADQAILRGVTRTTLLDVVAQERRRLRGARRSRSKRPIARAKRSIRARPLSRCRSSRSTAGASATGGRGR